MNLDEYYQNQYDDNFNSLRNQTLSLFAKKDGKTIVFKRSRVFETLNEEFKTITAARIDSGNYHPDHFTSTLVREFNNHYKDYEFTPVKFFFEEHLMRIKSDCRATNPTLPKNISLNDREIVNLLARYNALSMFLYRLDSIQSADTIETCENKLVIKTTVGSQNSDSLLIQSTITDTQEENNSKNFTLNRQVLAVKYLFKHSGIKGTQFDNTKLAEFIRFLTGRSPNVKHIRNSDIYKRLINPESENIEDLKFIRNYFSDLNMTEIVLLLDEEIASAKPSKTKEG